MPANASLAFREFGIVLVFAAVGLSAGVWYFETVFSATGPALGGDLLDRCPASDCRDSRERHIEDELYGPERTAGGQHHRSAGVGVRNEHFAQRCGSRRLRDRLSIVDFLMRIVTAQNLAIAFLH